MDGSDIKSQSRLREAVVHIPTRTVIYIDTKGTGETRTIMRAKLVAIHMDLNTFDSYEWKGKFIDSVSRLQALRHHNNNLGAGSSPRYYHHMFLLGSIISMFETRSVRGACAQSYINSGNMRASEAIASRRRPLN
jgi:hypothetical protein